MGKRIFFILKDARSEILFRSSMHLNFHRIVKFVGEILLPHFVRTNKMFYRNKNIIKMKSFFVPTKTKKMIIVRFK